MLRTVQANSIAFQSSILFYHRRLNESRVFHLCFRVRFNVS